MRTSFLSSRYSPETNDRKREREKSGPAKVPQKK